MTSSDAQKVLKQSFQLKTNDIIIENVDFKDPEASRLIKKYCLHSAPFDYVSNFNSISSREASSESFIELLEHQCHLSIAAKSKEGEYLLFIFLKKKIKVIDLYFAMPNTKLNLSPAVIRYCFYRLCLEAIKHFSIEEIKGKIFRKNKKNGMRLFFKRYIKAMTYEEIEDKPYDYVYLSKESILDHYEKL